MGGTRRPRSFTETRPPNIPGPLKILPKLSCLSLHLVCLKRQLTSQSLEWKVSWCFLPSVTCTASFRVPCHHLHPMARGRARDPPMAGCRRLCSETFQWGPGGARASPGSRTWEPSGRNAREPGRDGSRLTWGERGPRPLQTGLALPSTGGTCQRLAVKGSVKFSEGSYFLSGDFSIIFSWNGRPWLMGATGRLIG